MRNLSLYQNVTVVLALKIMLKASALGALLVWSLLLMLRDVIQKSVVIEQGGEKIGLIGLTMQNTDELAGPGPNVVFSDPSSAVQAELISSQPWV